MSDDTAAKETSVRVRAATLADADAVAATMARAFFDDPLICFILTNEETRQTDAPNLFHLLFTLGLPHGACDVTMGYEAAALWRPPGAWRTPWWDYLANGVEVFDIFDYGSARHALRVMDVIEKHHPAEPHWYLQSIGTDPAKQGKGFGGAVMRKQLANADASGLPAYLESSKDANIPFYRSFGFEVSGEIKLPDGPTLWPMWREAPTLR
jgi:ribosomal protein S18 acetylase RimI-like enzyme